MFFRTSVGVILCTTISAVHAADRHSTELEEVIVTGSPLSTDPDQTTGIIGKVNREDIIRQGGASLADSLARVPGVTSSGFASGASRPVIRGFDANRVRILENGVGSFDVSDVGPDHGVPIDPLSTQSVEVVRGAATLRYGSQAIGGVVNAINNRVPLKLPEETINGEVVASYASNANSRLGSALVDGKVGQLAMHADGFTRTSDDYGIPNGTQSNSYFEGKGYSLGSSYFFNKNNSRVGIAGIHFDSEYGIPGEDTFIDVKQDKVLFGSSLKVGNFLKNITIDAGYADYSHSEIDPQNGDKLATFNDKEWDLRGEGLFGEIGPFTSAAFGMEFQNRDFSALGEGSDYLKPTQTRSEAGFGFAETKLTSKLNLQLGARAESVHIEGTPISEIETSRNFTPISGSVGFLLETSETAKLGLNLSSTARAPAQTELFSRGPHDGPATYEIGDPTLDMERATSLEGTLRLRRDKFQFDAALWASSFDNYIYGRITGNTCNEEGTCLAGNSEDLRELIYEQRDANFHGIEAKSTFLLSETKSGNLSAELLADAVNAKFTHGGGYIPRIPPYHIGGGIFWESNLLDSGFFVKYSAKQTKVPDTETPTQAFKSIDAYINLRPLKSNQEFELSLVGSNLTNTEQRNAVALNKDEVMSPGRDIRLVLHLDF